VSAHRRHYCDLNPEQRRDAGFVIARAIAVAFTAIFVFSGVAALIFRPQQLPEPAAQPVHDARIEAFRAGFNAATEQGCTAAALSLPLQR
jgi:hypothetical protein